MIGQCYLFQDVSLNRAQIERYNGGPQLSERPVVREWVGEAIVGRGISTQVVGNVQVVAPVVVVVDLMVVRIRVVVGVGVVRFRMVVGTVVDWFRVVDCQWGWRSVVDDVVNRR